MKRIIWLIPLALILLTASTDMGNNIANDRPAADNTTIAKLWKDYESARKADRPQKELDILQEIKDAAVKERLPWDFYKAGTLFIDVSTSRNWKLRDSLNTQFRKEIKDFDEPVLSFYYTRNDRSGKKEFLDTNRSRLEKGRHEDFYAEDDNLRGAVFSPVLKEIIPNDWQYALWSLILGRRWDSSGNVEFIRMLEESLGTEYPAAAFLELYGIQSTNDDFRKKENLEEYVRKYNGKAVTMMARQALLSMELAGLNNDEKGTSDDYKAFRERLEAFDKDRKAFSGQEKKIADCCTQVRSFIEDLDDKSIDLDVEEGLLKIRLRNLDGVSVTIKDKDKTVLSTKVDNPVKSYYVLDTVSLQLPAFDDGEYTITCANGKVSEEVDYRRFGLSSAHKEDAAGYAVYVARAKSGEPIRKVDITLLDNKDKVLAELKDFALGEGFTYLPKDFTRHFPEERWNHRIVCTMRDSDGTLRKTPTSALASPGTVREDNSERTDARVLVDRSAFNPDETAHFKVVAYKGNNTKGFSVLPDKYLNVKLFNAEEKEIASQRVKTGEFGTAAGEFLLERQERGGMFRIKVLDGTRLLDDAYIRVDDFVLPTYDLSFEPTDKLYFPGDEIEVRGTLKSYSGHSLSAADIRYTVTRRGSEVISEGVLHPAGDGSFTISFEAGQESTYYNVNVGVSDVTGETMEWNTGFSVNRSIPFSAKLENASGANIDLSEEHEWRSDVDYEEGSVAEDLIRLSLHTSSYRSAGDLSRGTLRIDYTLKFMDKVLASGKAAPGDVLNLDTSGYSSGLYVFEAVAADKDVYGNEVRSKVHFDILKVKDGDTALDAGVRSIFNAREDAGGVTVQLGSTEGPVWAVVELYGTGNVLVASRTLRLKGVRGQAGSLASVRLDWPDSAPDLVRVNVLYFKDYREFSFSRSFDRSEKRQQLPLSFTRFLDRTAPGTAYSFEIQAKPGVECAATIFDKSSERIQPNRWGRIHFGNPSGPTLYIRSTTGMDRSDRRFYTGGGIMLKSAGAGRVYDEMVVEEAMPVTFNSAVAMDDQLEMPVDRMASPEAADEEMGADIAVREDFSKTIAFEPFLRSDASGKMALDFTTSDQLSTFIVQLFAHDKDLDNAVLRQEMTVTVPAKVSIVEPQFLYAGDRYSVKASLSSSVDETLAGRLRIDLYDGKDYKDSTPVSSTVKEVTLEPYGALAEELEIVVPENVSELGIKLTFIAEGDYGSDAVFVSVPVYKAVQTLTEAHSSILHAGESMEALLAKLRGEFVNVSAEGADLKDISLLEMVKEALPDKAEPASDNALDLSEALYVRLMAARLGSILNTQKPDAEILAKLMECRNDDGGFGWFKGMDSSPVITAVLLERLASLRGHGIGAGSIPSETVEAAVRFLDKSFFKDNSRPIWCGGLSEEQYVSVRAMYPAVEFVTKDIDGKELRAFRKRIKEYLTPRKERGLNGYVFGKARRMRTLMSLAGSDSGRRLAAAWDVRLATGAKLRNSLIKDLASLQEYAIAHPSGGWYYPNAVMPFRGLLESEAYAHAFITDLLRECSVSLEGYTDVNEAKSIADGISLWLMVQKETQHWDEDAAFVNAIASILSASQEVLDTRIISLSKTFTKPFEEVKAAGNGFTVERHFSVERTVDGKVQRQDLAEGDVLGIGDKVIAEYRIWNEENRSFVKLTAPRSASLRPVNQLSGHYGWWLRPLRVAGWVSFSPHGYRSVLVDRTEYWFDAYPEEKTTVTEEFFVTQAGSFQIPAVSIESLYAPHYRANDSAHAPLLSR